MNIKLIKAEIEKLSLLLSSWEGEESVSAIERDIALDKLKKIYDLVRFDAEVAAVEPIATPVAAPVEEREEEPQQESDVEVELIFADEEDFLSTLPEAVEEEDAESEPSLVEEILASAMVATPISAPAEIVPEIIEAKIELPEVEVTTPEIEPTPEPRIEPEPTPEPVAEEPTMAPEPQQEEKPAEEKPIEEKPVEEKPAKREEPRSLNSLFGMEEVQRRPRTKHQRMMSIYNDNEPAPEKVVDISKIFDMDVDAPKPMTSKSAEPKTAPAPKPAPKAAPAPVEEERRVTIADAIAATTQTLADTIVAPNALAEEINHSKIASLRDGIGINDKFLMIRDLFDGDDEAYDEAITALDSLESMDDCMIHIIENYTWNPDTEGSKFIMQLLERKLS
ncbi:MAG: hypothetical protein II976_06775 [Alistipes sp.]|nr:hypothetical protein [Alistipes sp.]